MPESPDPTYNSQPEAVDSNALFASVHPMPPNDHGFCCYSSRDGMISEEHLRATMEIVVATDKPLDLPNAEALESPDTQPPTTQ